VYHKNVLLGTEIYCSLYQVLGNNKKRKKELDIKLKKKNLWEDG
jgi:hypothetical protein